VEGLPEIVQQLLIAIACFHPQRIPENVLVRLVHVFTRSVHHVVIAFVFIYFHSSVSSGGACGGGGGPAVVGGARGWCGLEGSVHCESPVPFPSLQVAGAG
jgi:hypothetical protein